MQNNTEMNVEIDTQGRRFFGGPGRLILIGIVISLAVAYLIYAAFPGSTRYYFTVDELAAFDGEFEGRMFKVKGTLAFDSFAREPDSTKANFSITAGGEVLRATYSGVMPDLFFNEHSEIILQGRYDGVGPFEAETLSVLCPTKYQELEEQQVSRFLNTLRRRV